MVYDEKHLILITDLRYILYLSNYTDFSKTAKNHFLQKLQGTENKAFRNSGYTRLLVPIPCRTSKTMLPCNEGSLAGII